MSRRSHNNINSSLLKPAVDTTSKTRSQRRSSSSLHRRKSRTSICRSCCCNEEDISCHDGYRCHGANYVSQPEAAATTNRHFPNENNDDKSNDSRSFSSSYFQSFLPHAGYQKTSLVYVAPNHHHSAHCTRHHSPGFSWTRIISSVHAMLVLLLLSANTTSGASSKFPQLRSRRFAGDNVNNNEPSQNPYYSTSINYDAGVMRVHRALPQPPPTTGVDGGDSLTSWSGAHHHRQTSALLDDGVSPSVAELLRRAEARSAIGSCMDNESCVFSWVCDDIGKPVRFCSGPFFYFTVCCRSREKKQQQPALLQHHQKKHKKPVVVAADELSMYETTPANVIENYDSAAPIIMAAEPVSTTSTEPSTTTTTSSESPTLASTTSTAASTTTMFSAPPAASTQPTLLINITEFVKPTRSTLSSSSSTTLPSIITLQTGSLPAGGNNGLTLSTARTCGQAPLVFRNSRIVGGGDTQYGALSYQAMVVIKGQERCGGALLDNQWVVTGGHCVAPASVTAADVTVKLGVWDRSHDNELFPRVERKVKKFVLHQSYGKERSFANDVALLKLDRPVEYQPHIQPACLPEQPDEDFTGLYGTVSGWGRLNFRENRPDILQYVEVPIMTNPQCEAMFKKQETPEKIIDQMMCAGYDEGGRDACQGDSGGPMAIRKEGAWTLIGIVSWGYGCGLPGYPGVYTRVSKFSDWLVQTMWNDRD